MAQWSTGRNQMIFAVLDVSLNNGLNSDKTSKVFLYKYLLFFYQILFSCTGTTVKQSHPSSIKIVGFLISTPSKTRTFTVRLAVTTNTKETVLRSSFAILYQISSKLLYAFGLQTPITAECSMCRC